MIQKCIQHINEGKSVVAERSFRTIKNKIYKHMTLVLKNVYAIDKLDKIVNKYNNIYHSTIKMKTVDVGSSIYIDFNKTITKKILNLKLVIMLGYRNTKTFLLKYILHILRLQKYLKAEVDKIDIDKIKTVPVDQSKPSKLASNEVVKKIMHEISRES